MNLTLSNVKRIEKDDKMKIDKKGKLYLSFKN